MDEAKSESDEEVLSIWDHRYRFCGTNIVIHEDFEAGLGGTMFDGALCVCNFLEYLTTTNQHEAWFGGKKTMELGAGCGLPGLVLSKLGFDVTLSDMEIAMELLTENCEMNFKVDAPKIIELDWTKCDISDKFDIIIAADTVYDLQIVPFFIETCLKLSNNKTKIIFAHPAPRKQQASDLFWSSVKKHFAITKIDPVQFVPNIMSLKSQGKACFEGPTAGLFILTLHQ